jgi:regulatory protein
MDKNIHSVVMNWLARRDYTRHEINIKLNSKGYDQAAINDLLITLSQSGLINEGRFTENFIHWRRNKGYGPLRISMELRQRGIPDEVIAEHLQITDNAWSLEAQRVWHKRFKTNSLKNIKEKAKQQRFLQQRGFTREQINSVFDSE